MLHDMPNIPLSCVLLHVEEIAVQTAPKQRVLLSVRVCFINELSRIDLHIARVERIANP